MPNYMLFIWAHTKQVNPLLDFKLCVYDVFNSFMMNDDNLILHNLHFITAHFSFITAHLCSDNPLF